MESYQGRDDGYAGSSNPLRHLQGARAYGCGLAVLLGGAMFLVIFLGTAMGDCTPGPGCHDHDGLHILKSLAVALPIAAVCGIGMWAAAAVMRTALRPLLGELPVALILTGLTLGAAWFGISPAFELFKRWTLPSTS